MSSQYLVMPLALIMSIFVSIVRAENVDIQDKGRRQGMSYEEYANYRKQMRLQMDVSTPEKIEKIQQVPERPQERIDKAKQESSYGQGYHTRDRAESRAERNVDNRPDRPKVERFTRENGRGR